MSQYKVASGTRGMVASAHPSISSSGINLLRGGGNAMDAAIAMALTSAVIFPDMCGLGGDAFFLYYDAKKQQVFAVEGSGHSGEKYSIDTFKNLNLTTIPEHGVHSISVQGAIGAYFLGLSTFGSKSFKECASDSIHFAQHGFLASSKLANYIHKFQETLKLDESLSKIFLNDSKEAKKFGDLIVQPSLATTLMNLSDKGESYFDSTMVPDMVRSLNDLGNKLTIDDFTVQKAVIKEPISIDYRGHRVVQLPPVSQGVIHLESLAILSHLPMSNYTANHADQIHTMVEAKKLAFFDRIKYFGDPASIDNPIEKVLSHEHTYELARKIDPTHSMKIDEGSDHQVQHTTSMVVVDQWGNACSFIHSVSDVFGSRVMCPKTGVLFNNRQGTGFNLQEGHPNAIAPRKKTMSTLITYMIFDPSHQLKYVGNTPGGDNQPQWNLQTVVNLLDYQMNLAEALSQPRWFDAQSSNPQNHVKKNVLTIESSVDQEVIEQLKTYGHEVNVVQMCSGASQLIQVLPEGGYLGASDPRAEGIAIGY